MVAMCRWLCFAFEILIFQFSFYQKHWMCHTRFQNFFRVFFCTCHFRSNTHTHKTNWKIRQPFYGPHKYANFFYFLFLVQFLYLSLQIVCTVNQRNILTTLRIYWRQNIIQEWYSIEETIYFHQSLPDTKRILVFETFKQSKKWIRGNGNDNNS